MIHVCSGDATPSKTTDIAEKEFVLTQQPFEMYYGEDSFWDHTKDPSRKTSTVLLKHS